MMSKVLSVACDMNNGTKKNYEINDPKSNLTLSQINSAFDVAFEKNLFQIGAVKPISMIGATYIETIRTDIVE